MKKRPFNLQTLAADVHSTAVAKGWWTVPRSGPEILALVLSEVGEAVECVRNRELTAATEADGKPIGLPSEIADVVIRLLDFAGSKGYFVRAQPLRLPSETKRLRASTPLAGLYYIAKEITAGYEVDINTAVGFCFAYAKTHGFDLWQALKDKTAYNKLRAFRHGNKAA